ncbi:protocatechuate 3,4-dioxygenase subunit alpha [Streptomyces sp. NPDC057654]|uniref:protocatechuate 3,4-dioxygenase subunit alpha n=1 Tax=Streptomyces sp. NPDC057654 TaxID=3346196 RepID=UPI003680CDB4
MTLLEPTPAQTLGPFYGHALPFPRGGDVAPAGHPDTITVHGHLYDGTGAPVPDALVEFWQAGPSGSLAGAPGTLRRDRASGAPLGRDGAEFTGFARVAADGGGHYALRTLAPGPTARRTAPHLAVCVLARGLFGPLHTRLYLPSPRLAADPLLASLPPERAATLIAVPETGDRARHHSYRFDIRLQGGGASDPGGEETVFLDFRHPANAL